MDFPYQTHTLLYARYLIDDPERDWSEVEDVGALGLPDGLPGIYEEFLTRRLAATAEAWRLYRPLLGLLAVAQGDGLPPSHLRGAHRRAVPDLKDSQHDDALTDLDQYLAPRRDPEAPYRIYHRSFEEYLLASPDIGLAILV